MFEAIIPLRSKSSGLKNKNILFFKKRVNLVNFTIKKIINFKEISKIFILTDSELYKKKLLNIKKLILIIKGKVSSQQVIQELMI